MQILSSSLHCPSSAEAAEMEVVLASANKMGGENDDGPYRDEDVREWSRVDEDTGMHERARVETDRWRNNTAEASQSYGKVVTKSNFNTFYTT